MQPLWKACERKCCTPESHRVTPVPTRRTKLLPLAPTLSFSLSPSLSLPLSHTPCTYTHTDTSPYRPHNCFDIRVFSNSSTILPLQLFLHPLRQARTAMMGGGGTAVTAGGELHFLSQIHTFLRCCWPSSWGQSVNPLIDLSCTDSSHLWRPHNMKHQCLYSWSASCQARCFPLDPSCCVLQHEWYDLHVGQGKVKQHC